MTEQGVYFAATSLNQLKKKSLLTDIFPGDILSEESFQCIGLYSMPFLKNMEVQMLFTFSLPRDPCSVSAFLCQ